MGAGRIRWLWVFLLFLGVVAGDGTKEDVFCSDPTSTPAIFTVFSLLFAKLVHPLLAQMPLPRHTAPLPTTPHSCPPPPNHPTHQPPHYYSPGSRS